MNALYVRQSIDKKDSISIESQIQACLTENRGSPCRIYSDRGYSGSTTDRPGYTSMMHDIRGGQISGVIVYRLDRLSRSVSDFSRMWETFEKYHVSFASVNEKIDSKSPIGKAMIYIIMTFAQLERETIAERITDNYKSRLASGSWTGGKAPFGFANHKMIVNGKPAATLIPDSNSTYVKYIFERYADTSCSLSSLAKDLCSKNIYPAGRKAWDNTALSRILRSPVYVSADQSILDHYIKAGFSDFSNPPESFDGTYSAQITGRRSGHRKNPMPQQRISLTNFAGIIDPETWLKCQYKLDCNRVSARAPSQKYTWLTGLLKCEKCGYSLVSKRSAGKIYLCCSGRYNLHICSITSLNYSVRLLEKIILHRLSALISQLPSRKTSDQYKTPDHDHEILNIQKEIDSLLSSIHRHSETTASYIDKKIEKLQNRLDKLKKTEQNLQLQNEKTDIKELFLHMTNHQKYRFASVFIDKILLSDHKMTIFWHDPSLL